MEQITYNDNVRYGKQNIGKLAIEVHLVNSAPVSKQCIKEQVCVISR